MSDMNKPYEEEVDLQEIGEDINETPNELIDSENINNDEENVEDEEILVAGVLVEKAVLGRGSKGS